MGEISDSNSSALQTDFQISDMLLRFDIKDLALWSTSGDKFRTFWTL